MVRSSQIENSNLKIPSPVCCKYNRKNKISQNEEDTRTYLYFLVHVLLLSRRKLKMETIKVTWRYLNLRRPPTREGFWRTVRIKSLIGTIGSWLSRCNICLTAEISVILIPDKITFILSTVSFLKKIFELWNKILLFLEHFMYSDSQDPVCEKVLNCRIS